MVVLADTCLDRQPLAGLRFDRSFVGIEKHVVVQPRHGAVDTIEMADALDANAIASLALLARFDHQTNDGKRKRLEIALGCIVVHDAVLVLVENVARERNAGGNYPNTPRRQTAPLGLHHRARMLLPRLHVKILDVVHARNGHKLGGPAL